MSKHDPFGHHNAQLVSAPLNELTCRNLLTGSSMNLSPHILETLPWRKVNDFLAAVGTEQSIEGLAHRILREIGALLPFDYGAFTMITSGTTNHQARLVVEYLIPSGEMSEYFGHYIAVDPCVSLYPSTLLGVASWSLRDCEFTRDFARRYHTRHTLVLGNPKGGADAGFRVTLNRMTRSGFEEREMAACSAVRPHLHNLFCLVHSPQKAIKSRLAAAASACGLTPREQDVVLLLCDRMSSGEIADRLTISRRTVEKHIEHVYLKLGVHGRKGLNEEAVVGDALENALGDREA